MSKKRGNRKNDFDDDFDDTASKVSSIAESDVSSKSKKKGKGKNRRDDSDEEVSVPLPAAKKSEKVNNGQIRLASILRTDSSTRSCM